MAEPLQIELQIPPEAAGKRLDKVLAELFPEYSRSCLQNWLKQGFITLDASAGIAKYKVYGGESLRLDVPAGAPAQEEAAEDIALEIVHEDADIIVINKPPGLVVHPAAGNRSGTLQNGLLYRYPELAEVPRAGLVHRLDKDTSGLLVVARHLRAHKSLVDQLQARSMGREYDAIVQGVVISGGEIDQPVGRHSHDRLRMAVREGGREAVTHYRLVERFRAHSHLRVQLETGRTHQIRVHMAHIRKPVVGDPLYGGRLKVPPEATPQLAERLHALRRQALHASRLELLHPATDEPVEWSVELPGDMQLLLEALRDDSRRAGQN
ncbi:MAG TPA: 23S rRNA pseudouridine(1911/1915/1917) synthase RluD [Gammaproteobacteria bacterium]|nr:23S rRNA pseudouridine(1911/1915/1917) synthase RluD [Gammaproteobacteria bacterium]